MGLWETLKKHNEVIYIYIDYLMKLDISETVIAEWVVSAKWILGSFRPIVKKNHLHPIGRFSFIDVKTYFFKE